MNDLADMNGLADNMHVVEDHASCHPRDIHPDRMLRHASTKVWKQFVSRSQVENIVAIMIGTTFTESFANQPDTLIWAFVGVLLLWILFTMANTLISQEYQTWLHYADQPTPDRRAGETYVDRAQLRATLLLLAVGGDTLAICSLTALVVVVGMCKQLLTSFVRTDSADPLVMLVRGLLLILGIVSIKYVITQASAAKGEPVPAPAPRPLAAAAEAPRPPPSVAARVATHRTARLRTRAR